MRRLDQLEAEKLPRRQLHIQPTITTRSRCTVEAVAAAG